MKGSNEFTYFLVAGLMILAILLVIFNTGVQVVKKNTTTSGQQGFVEAVKTFSIPYVAASDTYQSYAINLGDKELKNGLLFGDEKINYEINKNALQAASVRFTVTSNNGLGKMMIKVNNTVIANRKFDPGNYEISIDPSMLSDKTDIEISVESSYWRIWAPSLYKLADVTIKYSSFNNDFSQYKFYLGNEFNNLEFAKIDLNLNNSIGNLIVYLNGNIVWNSPTANVQSINLDKTKLLYGDNIITFKGSPNSFFAGSARIVVVFLTDVPQYINNTGVVTAIQPFVGSAGY